MRQAVKAIRLIMVPGQEVKNRNLLLTLAPVKARLQSRSLSLLVFKVMGLRSLLRVKDLRLKVKVRGRVKMRVLTVTVSPVEETSPLKLQALAVKEMSLPMLPGRTADGMSLLQLPDLETGIMSRLKVLHKEVKKTSLTMLLHLKARRRMPVRQEVRRPKLALTLELLLLEPVLLELCLRRVSLPVH